MTPKEYANFILINVYDFKEFDLKSSLNNAKFCINQLIIQNGELYLNGLDGDYYRKKNAFLFEVKQELEKYDT